MNGDAQRGGPLVPGYWFSRNPDKAWGEKFFLSFVPFWFVYNIVVQAIGWLDTGNFWNIAQNVLMWFPYCVLLPCLLRRNSGVPWYRSYWFKFNLFIFWWVFLCTYFHTEYFFDVLGMRYRFPEVTLYLDSALCGPDETTALAQFKKIPPSMYFNATAFFVVYHTTAVVLMRRIRTMTLAWAPAARTVAWFVIVGAVSLFWGWGETAFYFKLAPNDMKNVWYENLDRMLQYGSYFYALYFVVAFPVVYRLDEEAEGARWSPGRVLIEASAVGMLTLLLIDLATSVIGGKL